LAWRWKGGENPRWMTIKISLNVSTSVGVAGDSRLLRRDVNSWTWCCHGGGSSSVLNEDDGAAMATPVWCASARLVRVPWTRVPSMEVGAGAGAHWCGGCQWFKVAPTRCRLASMVLSWWWLRDARRRRLGEVPWWLMQVRTPAWRVVAAFLMMARTPALIGYFSEWRIVTWRNLVEWSLSDIRSAD